MDSPPIDISMTNNNGNINNNGNNVLFAQLQSLTENLQAMVGNQNTNSNNALLATHEYLASEKKQNGAVRHEPYIKQHNTRRRQTKTGDKAGNPIVDDEDGGMDHDEGMTEDVQSDESEEESSEEESSSEEYEGQELNKRTYLMWTKSRDETNTIKPKHNRVEFRRKHRGDP
ncbi:324_t:CDS:2 [Ambispora gerdemannii]|uniref:324_t:CDS:1 n=1 Tax=Ambispora gerdemannii TaxID=144530 RepID=A0A9N9AGN6_9GLOM|nr:324_t:CDS:2 [Ambispora gerdemannii]